MMPPIETRKATLRARLKAERSAMNPDERGRLDAAIARRVIMLPAFHKADALFCYRSYGSEVDTAAIIDAALKSGMTVALPRCDTARHQLAWQRVVATTRLVVGALGIEEPGPDAAALVHAGEFSHPLALVPGLAFDREGYRIGYGGGYYDRFLPHFPGISIGVVRSPQLLDSLRSLNVLEPHDRPVDLVAWDGGVLSYGHSV